MSSPITATDQAHLRRALELAEGGRGRVSPNPLVGAVVARGASIIGEGFHAELGGLHAERAALSDCRERGEDPVGATMYVTLEPCAHQGRQPPCVDAILEAGISGVVIGSDDPSEKTAGKGPEVLRDGGTEVVFAEGDEATAAQLLNQPFRKHACTGLPLVTLKMAMSLDGQTATAPGDSPWISSEQSRELVHKWRAESDAIAVGIGTVLADDPLLTARIDGARQPRRVVFDSHARIPLESQLMKTIDQAPVLVVVGHDAPGNRLGALGQAGAETIAASNVESALRALGRREVTSLFLEGGKTLASSFLASGQVDESRTFIAPMLLGQDNGGRRAGPVSGSGLSLPGESSESSPPARVTALDSTSEQVGEDILVTARYKEW
jgi:diaminohydroxyphosphoribosylaminopyrimidine deaminase / 5-amino-6-(5-phosphoribosylamino)uracil reductase